MGPEAMLTTSEVGEILGYTSKGVRGLCERGMFPGAFQVGPQGPWRIPQRDVDELKARARAVVRRRLRREA